MFTLQSPHAVEIEARETPPLPDTKTRVAQLRKILGRRTSAAKIIRAIAKPKSVEEAITLPFVDNITLSASFSQTQIDIIKVADSLRCLNTRTTSRGEKKFTHRAALHLGRLLGTKKISTPNAHLLLTAICSHCGSSKAARTVHAHFAYGRACGSRETAPGSAQALQDEIDAIAAQNKSGVMPFSSLTYQVSNKHAKKFDTFKLSEGFKIRELQDTVNQEIRKQKALAMSVA